MPVFVPFSFSILFPSKIVNIYPTKQFQTMLLTKILHKEGGGVSEQDCHIAISVYFYNICLFALVSNEVLKSTKIIKLLHFFRIYFITSLPFINLFYLYKISEHEQMKISI